MSECQKKSGLFKSAVAISLGIIVSAFIITSGVENIKNSGKTIKIKGYAQKAITSDLAVWTGSFAVNSGSLSSGYTTLQTHLDKVLAYLKDQGIDRMDVTVSSVNSITNYKLNDRGYSTSEIAGYRLSQSVTTRLKDVQKIKSIARDSTKLLKEGVGFASQEPQYYYTKLDDEKINMLEQATRNAKERAEAIARASAGTVGAIHSARQGVFQITAPQSTSVSDYGIYDTSSIEKEIKAVVTVEYSIE